MLSSSSNSSTGSSYRCAAKGICDDKHDLAVRCETADKPRLLIHLFDAGQDAMLQPMVSHVSKIAKDENCQTGLSVILLA